MTPTRNKPSLNLDYLDGPITSEGWKNVIFLRSGRSIVSESVWPSEDSARDAIAEWENRCASLYRIHGDGEIPTMGWRWSDYSHTIQIPWGKE